MAINPAGVLAGADLMPGVETVQRVAPQIELGSTGLKRTSGIIDEEFLPQLRGRKATAIFREMSDNDPVVGALLFAIDRLLRQLEWRVEPASASPEDKQAAEFIEQCMDDMSHSWGDLISEVMTMLIYGFSWHEIVYKRRVGPWEKDPKKKSKYTDNKIGWRKIPIRSQETMLRWIFDDKGGIQGMVQLAPPYYQNVQLPIDKCLLFRTTSVKNNPEGRSMLRNAYRPWYMKKRIEEFEAIGVERDLAGLPVGKVPAEFLDAKEGSKEQKMVLAFRRMVRSVRRDEQEGIILPTAYDAETKMPMFDFELLSSGGSRQFDTSGIIQRYEQRILMTVLADFILVGHEDVGGSYALHTDKTGMFRAALNSLAEAVSDVFNRHAIPRLFALNAWKPNELPKIVPNNVDPPDLTQLGAFMTQMAGAGLTWFPDPELEAFIRDAAQLPKMDEQSEAVQEQAQRMNDIMQLAQQRLQMLQMEQQATTGAAQANQATRQDQSDDAANPDETKARVAQAQMQQQPQADPNAEAPRQAEEMHQQKLSESQQKMQHADEAHQAKLKADADSHSANLKANSAAQTAKLKGLTAAQAQKLKAAADEHKAKLKAADAAHKAKIKTVTARPGKPAPRPGKK